MTDRQPRKIAILGSTGSVGQQALEVIDKYPEQFRASVLTAQSNAGLLVEQALKHRPEAVVIANTDLYAQVKKSLESLPVKVYAGREAINDFTGLARTDAVITAMTGISGLVPTLNAINERKRILLANKESLVVAGEIIMAAAKRNDVCILPVDSEHSAIQQCLAGEDPQTIEKVFLTASGGPFRGMSHGDLMHVTRKEALQHPNWNMGDKITIDSATMMNKGLEMIEAKWLFDLYPDQIEVVLHPQSIIHSMVQFHDGSIKAQLGMPDMKHPIQYALNYPQRVPCDLPRMNVDQMVEISLERVKTGDYQCLDIATEAMREGGSMPCIMNAANEAAVNAFLGNEIPFLAIPVIIRESMQKMNAFVANDLEETLHLDREVKIIAKEIIKTFSSESR